MRRRRLTVLVPGLVLFFLAGPGRADDPALVQTRLLKDLTFLTGDECEGRGVGTKGIDLAADHIARAFAQAGLAPAGDKGTYFQNFHVTAGTRVDKPATMTLAGPLGQTITLEMDKNFTVLRPSGSGKVEAPVVFAGYGVTAPKHGYDDYAGLDVAGKVVVVLRRTPRFTNPFADPFGANDNTVDGGDYRDDGKAANAEAHKAAAVLLVNAGPGGDALTPSPRGAPRVINGDPGPFVSVQHVASIPVLQVRRALVDDMLHASGDTLATIEKDVDAALKPRGRPLPGWTCRVETALTHSRVPVKNVVGVLEGSGPHAEETIVIGAHYDHVGLGWSFGFRMTSGFGDIGAFGSPSLRPGSKLIHHGADDNASGTVTVMELARRFAAAPARQGRRLVFIAFTAEESGLNGSVYYCRRPVVPLDKTVAMMNLDMVGRLQDDRLEITGVGTAKVFEPLVDRLALKHHLKVAKVQTGFGPSDHQSFTMRGVPALEFFTGFHEQYHMPTDRVETIDVPGLARVAGLIGDVVAELRAAEKPPEYVKVTEPYFRRTALWSLTSSFGLVPHATDAKGGVLVQDVFDGTPAAKAGLKGGDRLVAVGGQAVADLPTYLRVVRALPPGEKVEVFALRSDKPTKFVVELARLNTAQTATVFGVTPDTADKDGLRVRAVQPNSTAAKAGLKPGDRLVEIAGKPAVGGVEAMRHLLGLNPGDKIELTYERDGKPQKTMVALAFDPTGVLGRPVVTAVTPPPSAPVPAAGTGMRQIGVSVSRAEGADAAVVTRVTENSDAARGGLLVGDRVTAVAGKPVRGANDYFQVLGGCKDGDGVDVTVERTGKKQTLKMTLRLISSR